MAAKKAKKASVKYRSRETAQPRQVALEFVLPDDMVSQFADNLVIAHTGNEFILSFLQTQHPLITKPEEAAKLTSVEARCVARIVVTPAGMDQIVDAMQKNLERYQSSFKKGEE